MTVDEAKATLSKYRHHALNVSRADLGAALAAMIAEAERLTARAEAAEAALDAMRVEPTAEEVEAVANTVTDWRSRGREQAKAALTAFLAARGK